MGNVHLLVLILGLLGCLVFEGTNGQIYAQQPNNFARSTAPRGSVSRASNTVREREYNYGPLEFSQGISNSRTVTKNNGGIRNGGSTSIARSNAISRELNLGGVDVGGTFTRSQTKTNGAVSNSLGYDFNIGNLGIGSSISRENLRNGFGLHRNSDGSLGLGLGLLDVDLTRNAQQKNQALSQAQVNVQGRNAQTRANSNTQSNAQQYGNIGVTDTISRSNAFGSTRFGQTSANSGNLGGSTINPGAPNFYRPRRNIIPYKRIQSNSALVKRPKRFAKYISGINIESKEQLQRSRRQFQYPGQRQNIFNPQSNFFYPQNQNAYSQGIANNKENLFQQQSGANTHANKKVTQNGVFQDSGSSSIGSNIANDGLSGQVSSANTAEMNSQTLDGLMMSNNAQSQSLNFDPNQQQAASSNAGTAHSKTKNSERIESNSGSQVANNNQFGSSTNIANTNSAVYHEGNIQGVQSDASSQSIFQGINGETSEAFTNSNTNSVRGPDGFISNSAVSNASASSQGGKDANASASASASSVSNANGASSSTNSAANANGLNIGGSAMANSGANSGFGFQGFRRVQRGTLSLLSSSNPLLLSRLDPYSMIKHVLLQKENNPFVQIGVHNIGYNAVDFKRYSLKNENVQQNGNCTKDNQNPVFVHNNTEQFSVIDENRRQERTFGFITDFFNSLFYSNSCITPCTVSAFQQNRCCLTVIVPPPPPQVCCSIPAVRPMPPPAPPRQPPIIVVPPVFIPPINCCNMCTAYNYYGPPPCYAPYGFTRTLFRSSAI